VKAATKVSMKALKHLLHDAEGNLDILNAKHIKRKESEISAAEEDLSRFV
jgi:hypothetical protein